MRGREKGRLVVCVERRLGSNVVFGYLVFESESFITFALDTYILIIELLKRTRVPHFHLSSPFNFGMLMYICVLVREAAPYKILKNN